MPLGKVFSGKKKVFSGEYRCWPLAEALGRPLLGKVFSGEYRWKQYPKELELGGLV